MKSIDGCIGKIIEGKLQFNKLYIVFLLLMMGSISVFAEEEVSGAGAVLYTSIRGSNFVLLADHKGLRRGWAAFGGGLDNEEPVVAAAREVEEETNGLLEKSDLLKKLGDAKYIQESNGQWQYTTYFLKIDFKASSEFNAASKTSRLKSYNERGPYSWVPVSELSAAVMRYRKGERNISIPVQYLPSCSGNNYYWNVFLKSLDEAFKQGVVNW